MEHYRYGIFLDNWGKSFDYLIIIGGVLGFIAVARVWAMPQLLKILNPIEETNKILEQDNLIILLICFLMWLIISLIVSICYIIYTINFKKILQRIFWKITGLNILIMINSLLYLSTYPFGAILYIVSPDSKITLLKRIKKGAGQRCENNLPDQQTQHAVEQAVLDVITGRIATRTSVVIFGHRQLHRVLLLQFEIDDLGLMVDSILFDHGQCW